MVMRWKTTKINDFEITHIHGADPKALLAAHYGRAFLAPKKERKK